MIVSKQQLKTRANFRLFVSRNSVMVVDIEPEILLSNIIDLYVQIQKYQRKGHEALPENDPQMS